VDPWVVVDRWLLQIVKHVRIKGGFRLTLRRWPEVEFLWDDFFPEFRESVGEIKLQDW